MTDLFEKSIATLELPKVLEQLSACAATQEGKERSLALRPMTDPDDVRRALDETSAAVDLLIQRGSPGFSGVKPVAASLHRADMGGSLNTRELLEVAAVLRCARTVQEYGSSEEKTPISHLFRALTPNRFLEDTITNSIVGEDELADSASSELASIRRHMRATEAKVRDILQKIISSNQSKYLQESIITIRSDRYVVPVKSEFKNAIPGLVHDVSSSGSTFFIEPMGVVKANNELRELAAREKKEIERILAELSAQCAAHKEDISEDYDLLIWLDTIFARGGHHLCPGQAVPEHGGQPAPAVGEVFTPAKGPAPPAGQEDGGGQRPGAGGQVRYPDDHRPQHRRQDGDVKDHRPAHPHGPVRPAHPRRGGLRRPGV